MSASIVWPRACVAALLLLGAACDDFDSLIRCDGSSATECFVQSASVVDGEQAPTQSTSFNAPTQAGDLLVVLATYGDESAIDFAPSATDTLGNTYVAAARMFELAGHQSCAVLYAVSTRGGSDTVTVSYNAPGYPTPGGGESFRATIIAEYRGPVVLDAVANNGFSRVCDGNNFIDQTNCIPTGTPDMTDGVTSGQARTSRAGELIVGAVLDDSTGSVITAGSGFKVRETSGGLGIEDRISTDAGPVSATFSFGARSNFVAAVLAFHGGS
jgi:hypothetical protein